MDRNSIIGFTLIAAILIGWTLWTAPSAEDMARAQHEQDSLAQVELEKKAAEAEKTPVTAPVAPMVDELLAAVPDSLRDSVNVDSLRDLALVQRYGLFSAAAEGKAEQVLIENDKLQIGINTKGGRPDVIRLKDYKTYKGQPLLLQDPDSGTFAYQFFLGNLDVSTADMHFTAEQLGPGAVRLKAPTSVPDKYVSLTYRLDSSGYFLHSDLELVGLEQEVDPGNLFFQWDLYGLNHEKHLPSERQKSSIYYKYFNGDRDYLSETDEEDSEKLEGRTNWIAFKQDFFSVALVSDQGFASSGSEIAVAFREQDSVHTKRFNAKVFFEQERSASVKVPMRMYLGPNHYNTLRRTGIDQFDRIIDLGWGIFGWMNRWLVIPIFNFLDGWNWSYGIIILVLTIVIKLLLMPLTWKNFVASARMRVLKPEMDAINAKHKEGDAEEAAGGDGPLPQSGREPGQRLRADAGADAHSVRHVPVLPKQHRAKAGELPLGRRPEQLRQRVEPALRGPLLRRPCEPFHPADGREHHRLLAHQPAADAATARHAQHEADDLALPHHDVVLPEQLQQWPELLLSAGQPDQHPTNDRVQALVHR
ncbi:MAG: membrane protein insertase YidC [Flavobacteriales bacterium]|nr:membrane protein insertase YidC [Flavobacteriales bacterium]